MTAAPTPETDRPQGELITTPSPEVVHASQTTWLGQLAAAAGAILAVLYLSNVGLGVAELIPDNIPLAGNIDEVLFTLLLVYCLRRLGIDLAPHLASRL